MKKRIFYIDFIRVICMIMVLVYHYIGGLNNWVPLTFELPIGFGASVTFGELAVAVFFMISGSSLYYSYKDKNINMKNYYLKRIKSILPLFWFTWFLAFIYNFYFFSFNIDPTIPWWTLIFSILGIDQYVTAIFGIKTFAFIGEWFLGCIMIYYLIFPFLIKFFKRYPMQLFIACMVIYALAIYFPLPNINTEFNPIIHLVEFVMGMYLIKFMHAIEGKLLLVIISFYVFLLGCNGVFDILDDRIKYMFLGLSFYIIMIFISNCIHSEKLKVCFSSISKYSYAVFLNHHFIIAMVLLRYRANRPDLLNSYDSLRNALGITLITITLIIVISYYMIRIENKILKWFSRQERDNYETQ